MTRPLFSIAIPTFNYGRFLRRAVDSVLAQPGDDFELIVADDGSTDDTPLVAASYGTRLTYLRQERQGVYQACKRGFDASTGRFLIFLDADDALAPGALAALRREVERRTDVGIVAGRHVNVAGTGQRLSPRVKFSDSRVANFRGFLLGRLFVCTGAAAIRREAVELVRRYEGALRVGMETACVAQTLWHYDAASVDDVLLEVHDHPDRLRNNVDEIRLAGDALVDALFDPAVLPPEAARFRSMFRARLLRDRSRSYHKAGDHEAAIRNFGEALRADPIRSVGDTRNLRRFLLSVGGRRFGPARLDEVTARPTREAGVVEASGGEFWRGHRRRMNDDAVDFLLKCGTLGGVVKLRLARPTYLLNESRDIQHVLVKQPHRYRRTGLQAAFRQLFGRGLFSLSGKSHIEQRRQMQPFFHRARLDKYLPAVRQAVAEMVPHWSAGQALDVNGTMSNLTLRAAGRLIFGFTTADEGSELFDWIHASHQRVARNLRSSLPGAAWLPTRRNRLTVGYIRRLDAATWRLIAEARAQDRGECLLAQLVEMRDAAGRPLDDRQIRDQVLPIFLAAYEPTATALSWLLYLLATHPDVQRRLRQEVDEATSRTASGDAAALLERPYMTQVLQETLRLYPSTWLVNRRATMEDALPSGATIPAGADVFTSPLLVHRDPRRFADPDEFRPERFAEGAAKWRAAGDYFPFGMGPAACIGEYLARMMMAATADAVVGRFEVAPLSTDAPRMFSTNLFTMQPDRLIRLQLLTRAHCADQRSAPAA